MSATIDPVKRFPAGKRGPRPEQTEQSEPTVSSNKKRKHVISGPHEDRGPSLAHYKQHHDVISPLVDSKKRQYNWQVDTRLSQLHDKKLIDRYCYDAGVRYRNDHDIASGVRGERGPQVDCGSAPGGITQAVLDATRRVREAHVAVGPIARHLLELCVVQDMSWRRIGLLLGGADKLTARVRTIEALVALLAHYETTDQLRRQGSGRIRAAYSAAPEKNLPDA
jgi:hypothetical protein